MHRQQPKQTKTMNLLEEKPHDWRLLKSLIPDIDTKSHIPGGPIEGADDYELTHDMLVRPRSSLPFERRYALIVDTIGKGACGAVYGVEELAENVYGTPEKVSSPRVAKMLKLEDAKKEIKHSPRHLGMKRIVVSGETGFIIMRRMPGVPLSDAIKNLKRQRLKLTSEQLINLMAVILETIRDQVHAHGFVHRDIKPANIMVDHPDSDYPVVNIIDYGYAKESKYIDIHEAYGSPDYMSLESATFKGTSEKSDVFSAGVTLLELSGVSIWNASVPEASRKRLNYPVPDDFAYFAALDPALKKRFKQLIHAMTRSDQDDLSNKRTDLNKAILDCNMIRLLAKAKMLGLNASQERQLHDAYSAASDARVRLKKISTTVELRQVLISAIDRIGGETYLLQEFLQALRFSSLSFCKNKSEFIAAIDEVISGFNNVKSLMSIALEKAKKFSEMCRHEKIFDHEYMRKIADEQVSLLERKLNKLDAHPMDVDLLLFHSEKYQRLALNIFTPYEMKIKYLGQEIIREIDQDSQHEKDNKEMIDIVVKISDRNGFADDTSQKVRQQVRLMLMQYMSDYARQTSLRLFGDGAKSETLSVIQSLMRDMKSAANVDEIIHLLKAADVAMQQERSDQCDLSGRIQELLHQFNSLDDDLSPSL